MPVVCSVSLRDGHTTRFASSHDSRENTTKSRPACVNHITPAAQREAARQHAQADDGGLAREA